MAKRATPVRETPTAANDGDGSKKSRLFIRSMISLQLFASVSSFSPILPPSRDGVRPPSFSRGGVRIPPCSSSSPPLTALKIVIPNIDDWSINDEGEVMGTIRNHPVIADGETITTSPLVNPDRVKPSGGAVATTSGSRYRLTPKTASNNRFRKLAGVVPKKYKRKKSEKTISNGKYYLLEPAIKSTSGKSDIYTIYRTDAEGLPTGVPLIAKLSPNYHALSRENGNYDKAAFGPFFGRFVEKIEFIRDLRPNNAPKMTEWSGLILEGGSKNVKDLLKEKGSGLRGKAMRDAAAIAAQCAQAMHSSILVWTDLKTENFVCVEDVTGEADEGLRTVKGIDLESARPLGKNPVDYSPEACPPEFARAFIAGDGADFVLKKSYDIWSLGMYLYECSTGREYFEGKSPMTITKTLASSNFSVDVSDVEDDKLRDLIEACLQLDPNKRPGITRVLLHPYFTTTGIGIFSF